VSGVFLCFSRIANSLLKERIPPFLSESQVELAELLVSKEPSDVTHFLEVVQQMPPAELDDRLQQITRWSEELAAAQDQALARAEALGLV
jgi:hypothetical protein